MTTIEQAEGLVGSAAGFLDRERIIAKAGFNRWLVPPAALCIHLCIGMAYGFSVFWLPLSRALGVTQTVACPDMTLLQELLRARPSAAKGRYFVSAYVSSTMGPSVRLDTSAISVATTRFTSTVVLGTKRTL